MNFIGKRHLDEGTRTVRTRKRGRKLALRAGRTAKPGIWRNSLEGWTGQLHKAMENGESERGLRASTNTSRAGSCFS